MNLKSLVAVSACLALAFVLPKDSVRFVPEAGTRTDKRFSTEVNLTLEKARTLINGLEQDAEALAMRMTVLNSMEFAWIDAIETVATIDGAPVATRTKRLFTKLSGTTESTQSNSLREAPQESKIKSASALEGLSVQFDWRPDALDFAASFCDLEQGQETPDKRLIERLSEDTDLRQLLPLHDVNVGDQWQIDSTVLQHLVAPGGELNLQPDLTDGGETNMGVSFNDLFGDLAGTIDCEYLGMRIVNEHSLAAINIKVDVTSQKDLMAHLTQTQGQLAEENSQFTFEAAAADLALEASGELLWSMESGVLERFVMDGKVWQKLDTAMTINSVEGDFSIEQELTMAGTIKLRFSATKL